MSGRLLARLFVHTESALRGRNSDGAARDGQRCPTCYWERVNGKANTTSLFLGQNWTNCGGKGDISQELFETRAKKHMFCCKFYKLVACGGNKNLGHDRNLDVSQPQLLRKWVSHVCPSANLQIHKYTNTILIVQPVNTNTIVCNQDTKICIWLVGSSYWSDSFFKMRRMRNPHWGSVGACCWERMRRRGLFTC